MKVTIYELLGMIKDGKAPKKIKYDGQEYKITKILLEDNNIYFNYINEDMECIFPINTNYLNDEIEILKEEKKIPEKIEEPRFNKGRYYIKDINGDDSEISGIERTFRLKINEIIDCLDYLKSKGADKE